MPLGLTVGLSQVKDVVESEHLTLGRRSCPKAASLDSPLNVLKAPTQ